VSRITRSRIAYLALGLTLGVAMALAGAPVARLWTGQAGDGARPASAHAVRMQVDKPSWVATWAAAPQGAGVGAAGVGASGDKTIRDVIYTSVGGTALRVKISNRHGTRPLDIGAASVGTVLAGAGLLPATTRPLAFGPAGKGSVRIPAGATVTSDPVSYDVQPLTELAISLYLPVPTGPTTGHLLAQQNGYVADGDQVDTSRASRYDVSGNSWYFLTEVDVRSVAAGGTIVAFGDSITDGTGSHAGSDGRWPNYLARRLQAVYGDRAPGVVDEGISGNRVLTTSACGGGTSALLRFGQDALGVTGVRAVVLLEGINDINFATRARGRCVTPASRAVTAGQIEGGYRQLIAMAHARGVAVYLGTLTPTAVLTPAGASMRVAVNRWILASAAAHISDGVVNFAGVVADPSDPAYLNPACNSGDGLHPNDLGYNLMAGAIPLAWARSAM